MAVKKSTEEAGGRTGQDEEKTAGSATGNGSPEVPAGDTAAGSVGGMLASLQGMACEIQAAICRLEAIVGRFGIQEAGGAAVSSSHHPRAGLDRPGGGSSRRAGVAAEAGADGRGGELIPAVVAELQGVLEQMASAPDGLSQSGAAEPVIARLKNVLECVESVPGEPDSGSRRAPEPVGT